MFVSVFVYFSWFLFLFNNNNKKMHTHGSKREHGVRAAVQESTARSTQMVNRCGPFLGVVVPNAFEMEPLLRSPSFSPAKGLPPYLDVAGTHYMNTSDLLALLPFFFRGSWELIGFYFYLKNDCLRFYRW